MKMRMFREGVALLRARSVPLSMVLATMMLAGTAMIAIDTVAGTANAAEEKTKTKDKGDKGDKKGDKGDKKGDKGDRDRDGRHGGRDRDGRHGHGHHGGRDGRGGIYLDFGGGGGRYGYRCPRGMTWSHRRERCVWDY